MSASEVRVRLSQSKLFIALQLAKVLVLRSVPVDSFLEGRSPWPLSIASINEDRLLKEFGLSTVERNEVEGIKVTSAMQSRAAVALAYDPPDAVARIQKLAFKMLLRPFLLGLRFSGANMNPLPGWLGGAQNIAINMSNNDLPLQLHHALFKSTSGYVLKPPEMRHGPMA